MPIQSPGSIHSDCLGTVPARIQYPREPLGFREVAVVQKAIGQIFRVPFPISVSRGHVAAMTNAMVAAVLTELGVTKSSMRQCWLNVKRYRLRLEVDSQGQTATSLLRSIT